MAILQVVINPLLRVSGGEENYAFTSVMAQLIFGLASFISPLVYSWLVVGLSDYPENTGIIINTLRGIVPESMSWVSMYWTFAVFSMLMILIISLTKFPSVDLQEDEKAGSKSTYVDLLKNKYTILYFFGIFSYVGSEQGISYWMSKFLSDYHQINPEVEGANAVAYFWGLMTVGGILGLILLKVMDSKLVLKIFTLLAMLCLGLALYGPLEISYYSFMISGFFLSVMFPIIMSLALNSVPKHHGSFAGILMTGIMGGAVVQIIVGFISDFTSLKTGMLFVFITLAYILSIAFWAKPIINNKTVKLKDLLK
jgi:fucose permease